MIERGTGAILAFALLAMLVPGTSRAQDPLSLYRGLPPDSTEARAEVVAADPAGFAAAFDSALVAGASDATLEPAALDYLTVTGDSLLLSDLRFVRSAPPEGVIAWYEAVEADARGRELRQTGDAQGAIDAFTSAAETYREVGHLRREAVAWGSLGVAWWGTGEWDQVEAAYRNALDARERLGDPVLIGRTLNGLGTVAFQQGRYPEALEFYTRARDVRETIGNPVDLAVTLTYIGNVNLRLGNLDEARSGYLRALELLGPDAPPRRLNETRGSLALVYNLLGRPEEALALQREVLASAVAAGDAETEANTRTNMARDLLTLGDAEEALRELVTAREIQEEEDLRFYLAETLSMMGRAYIQLGDQPRALEVLTEAREVAAETGNLLVSLDLLQQMGLVYRLMGLSERALASYGECMELADSLGAAEVSRNARFLQANLLEEQGERDEALAIIEELIVSDREQEYVQHLAADLVTRGNVLTAMGRWEEGLQAHRDAVETAEAFGLVDRLWQAYLGVADAFEQGGELDSARVYNDLAIETLEQMGGAPLTQETGAALVGSRAFVYEAQVHVLAQLDAEEPGAGFGAMSFETAERGKARVLLDMLAEGRVDLEAGFDPALVAERDSLDRSLRSLRYRLRLATEEGATSGELKDLKREIREREGTLADLLERMRLQNPRFATLDAGKPADLEAIRHTLLDDGPEVLLAYSLGDSASYLWVLTGDELSLHPLPPRSEVEAATQTLRSALRNPDPAGDETLVSSSATLFGMILAPAMRQVREADRVYIVPDGALHFVPFEVLVERAEPGPGAGAAPEARARYLRDLPYALARRQVLYGPSATTLVLLAEARGEREPAGSGPVFLGVGDPAFLPAERAADAPLRGTDLAPLPYTRDEVESIASAFPEGSATVLVGEEAREATLCRPGYLDAYRVIHFATHGLVDERRPERSSLALAFPRDPSEDGYLQASEIYGLRLDADLVVLSACETALGKMVRGEGVLGLPRAFLYSGASSVVVSLWSVSDRSTAELMRNFYGELVGEGKDAASALAGAKDALRESGTFAHPFYWAPFVLLGPS